LFAFTALAVAVASVPLYGQAPAPSEKNPATTSGARYQTASLPETDPSSPRRTKLKSEQSNEKEVIFTDVDNDGDPDILETWWNGKRVRWFDENDNMKPTDVRGDMSSDALQVDREADGYYDGPGDISIKWCDDDADGKPDAQIIAANPAPTATRIASGSSHFMVFIDTDKDGVNGYIPWDTFSFDRDNWRVKPGKNPNHALPAPNFSADYMGNSIFLKQHLPPWIITDIRLNWENPFAFYDFDGDGVTEMTIRFLDIAPRDPHDKTGAKPYSYTGKVTEAMGGWDLDNDSTKGNEFDFDMSWKFTSAEDGKNGETIDYTKYSDKHPNMKAPAWVLEGKYFRYDNWRKIDDFCYVTHDKCFEEMWKTNWRDCWISFDEDDDDQRWERVEFYYPVDDAKKIYNIEKWKSGAGGPRSSIMGHTQADSLGDRGEWDRDNSGKGKVYVGRFDGKLHLYGAETGAWLVDKDAKYWGGTPVVVGSSSKERATKPEEVVQYQDTDGNGFFDKITYDYNGDQKVDTEVSLLEYKTAENPNPDKAELINPAEKHWKGMHETFTKMAEKSFDDGQTIYRAAWKKGLTTPEIDDYHFASSTGEKYDSGYWMKEKVFRLIDKKLADNNDEKSKQLRADLKKHHFTGDVKATAALIDGL
ncbi:MAG: hypothetical protein M3478_06950, partial [Planctomycetota bacterium]|nr:hypothetical protein [Planctomycetota bacterium]